MCIPCGPRHGTPGIAPFSTLYDVMYYSLDRAREEYPDNEEAMAELKEFIVENIEHTDKWMINELYDYNRALLRIAAIDENTEELNSFYRKEKKKYKAALAG